MHNDPRHGSHLPPLRATPTWAGWLYLLLPPLALALVFAAVGIGYDGLRRAALFLPGAWFAWRWLLTGRRRWQLLTHLWVLAFVLDAIIRIYLWLLYQARPDSAFLLFALANTGSSEVGEFFLQYLPQLAAVLAIVALALGWFQWLPRYRLYARQSPATGARVLVGFLCLLLLAGYALRPSREAHPLLYWSAYPQRVQAFRERLEDTATLLRAWDDVAAADFRGYEGPERQTFVLVIGESTTRFNMQLCGYPRETTPRLSALAAELAVFCRAWSPAASTVPSMRLMLTSATLAADAPDEQGTSLLAMARRAGFRLYWISNQDDQYSWSLFGKYADEAVFLNRRSGRDSKSLDESVLPDFRRFIAEEAPRKLVVVHLIGAHPNYESRYGEDFAHFDADSDDAIEEQMRAADRSAWVRWQRNNYDNVVRYQDYLLGEMHAALKALPGDEARAWLYVSDHGNEVGHERDFVGHSPISEAGYAVPVLYWSNRMDRQQVAALQPAERPILVDVLDDNLLNLLGIRSVRYLPQRDWFSGAYEWQPPPRWPLWLQQEGEADP